MPIFLFIVLFEFSLHRQEMAQASSQQALSDAELPTPQSNLGLGNKTSPLAPSLFEQWRRQQPKYGLRAMVEQSTSHGKL